MDKRGTPKVHVWYEMPYKAIVQYGKDWKKVEQYVKTRTGSQIRSHAQKFFTKLEKANPAH